MKKCMQFSNFQKDQKLKIKRQILSLQINTRQNFLSFSLIFFILHSYPSLMQQTIEQPATHSLLRSSQRRRQSFYRIQPNSSPSNNLSYRPQSTSKQKYHYNYSKQNNPSSHKKGISSSLYESKYLYKQQKQYQSKANQSLYQDKSKQINVRHSMIVSRTQQKVVVCQTLPQTRPKYSFTFSNLPQNTISKPGIHPQVIQHTPRASLISNQASGNASNAHPSSRSPDIRKDMDVCLYAISDKLKQIQEQEQHTKNLIQSKFRSNQDENGYRPSISQIRKNKKMYLDKSIHRIHPEIVNEYIETVYREYDIPDPLKSGEKKQKDHGVNMVKQISTFEVLQTAKNEDSLKPRENIERQSNRFLENRKTIIEKNQRQMPSSRIKNQANPENPIVLKSQNLKTLPFENNQKPYRQQYYIDKAKPQNQRKNNFISAQSNQQEKFIKNRKKKFLALTLSKEKHINSKNFSSPQQVIKPSSRQQNSSRSQSQKSKQRQSHSQKKILQIKKNIATWNDHQHQYAERYSYIQSPYEMIRPSRPQSTNQDSKQGAINIIIRPFEQLMKATIPTEANQHHSTKGYNNTTQNSQFLESKYVQSFFTQQGEVMEEFRFCILCELPVLSANISKHEEKCIGWINDKGRLIGFKDLYKIQNEDDLKQVIKGKIAEIKKRMKLKISELKERENLDPTQKSKLTTNIMQSVQNLVQTFILMTDFDTQTSQNSLLFSSGYKKIQQNYKSEYIQLLQESKKLHWFVKLLQNYERRMERLNTTQSRTRNEKGFPSTMAKNNQTLTFIQEEQSPNNQVISEFGSQREH